MKLWPLGYFIRVLGNYFTYFWGPKSAEWKPLGTGTPLKIGILVFGPSKGGGLSITGLLQESNWRDCQGSRTSTISLCFGAFPVSAPENMRYCQLCARAGPLLFCQSAPVVIVALGQLSSLNPKNLLTGKFPKNDNFCYYTPKDKLKLE